jgi:hypothetical protein
MQQGPLSDFISHYHSNSLVCTSAGILGGVAKAIDTPHLLMGVTFDGGFTVAAYAVVSSVAAYLAKMTLDYIRARFLTVKPTAPAATFTAKVVGKISEESGDE